MKKKICNICKRKYKVEERVCPMCHSSQNVQCLHEWVGIIGFDELFSNCERSTISLTNNDIVVMVRRPSFNILETGFFSLLNCINYALVFNEPYCNIKRVYNTERNRKRFIEPLRLTIIEMNDGKEYYFARFKDAELDLFEYYTKVKADY